MAKTTHRNHEWLAADFETDAHWFMARAWRGMVIVIVTMVFILVLFNIMAALLSDRQFVMLGRQVVFPELPYRVTPRAAWVAPVFVLGTFIVLNRIVGLVLMRRAIGFDAKVRVFDFFVYTAEALALITWKFFGGVESPMTVYFLGHIVALSSVVTRRSLFFHIAFISVVIAAVGAGEYAGLIPHNNYIEPALGYYRRPEYIYMIVMSTAGYLVYIGVGLSAVFRKFEERHKAHSAAVEAKNEADLYLDLMSHDITNYNQMILSGIGLIERKDAEGRFTRYIDLCKSQVFKSERLIANVRAFSMMKQSGVALQYPVDLIAGVSSALRMARQQYPTRRVDALVNGPDTAEAVGGELIEIVLFNIIENAVKHHPGAEVGLEITIRAMPAPDDAWHITIADNGCGIPDDAKARVFQRFERGGDGTRGLGLGLSLSAAIVERCGGSISVHDCVPGLSKNGCQFTIILPRFHRPSPLKTDLHVIENPVDERQAREG